MTIHQHVAAGIDLGSNTFRLLVANCTAGSLEVLAKKMETVRLGRGLEGKGLLHEDSMQKGLAVLRSFRETLALYQPQSLRICGTEALRQARNSPLFLGKAQEILQHPVDIISGEEEAALSLSGALAGFTEPFPSPLLLVDVGGGSTELVLAESPAGQTRAASVGLGVVRLTEKFLAASTPDPGPLDNQLAETLAAALEQLGLLQNKHPVQILGCGGTATSMAALDLNLTAYNSSLVHGHVLRKTAMEKLWNRLIALPADRRNRLPGLGEGRGEILPAGLRIYHILLQLLQQDRMRVSDTGLLEGIMLSSISGAPA
jgi:exopolyphosphatase/guanosine-5'-triphosphate,3'-diphosphate pyrophosphatase